MQDEPEALPSTGWLQVGERAPTDLVDARLQLHWAIQLVSAVGTTLLPAAADDSHTNLEWLAEPGLLAGHLTADAPRCRAALQVTDLRLYLLNEGGAASSLSDLAARSDQSCPEAPRRGERAIEMTPAAGPQRQRAT